MEFWKEVRRQVLTGQLSQRGAMKQYGLGWHTLKKILAHDEPPGYRQRLPRTKRKLEPFLPIVRQILEDDRQAPRKQRHTAHRIFERLRDEFLSQEVFETVSAARKQTAAWREDYNHHRPHSSLGYLTPAEFATRCRDTQDCAVRCGTTSVRPAASLQQPHSETTQPILS
jgi:hypothetical protein